MTKLAKLKAAWLADPKFAQAYTALDEGFELARTLIAARARAGLSQVEVAKRMHTSQSVVAQLEANSASPNLSTLRRYAAAVGCKLTVSMSATPSQAA